MCFILTTIIFSSSWYISWMLPITYHIWIEWMTPLHFMRFIWNCIHRVQCWTKIKHTRICSLNLTTWYFILFCKIEPLHVAFERNSCLVLHTPLKLNLTLSQLHGMYIVVCSHIVTIHIYGKFSLLLNVIFENFSRHCMKFICLRLRIL